MVFSQGVKRPMEMIFKRLSSPIGCRNSYSTWASRGRSICEAGDFRTVVSSNDAYPHHGFGMFLRRYAVEIPASEQMSLIKQLRERTSAPIKDVKSSLIDCNWDIEAAQKDLRKRGVVLASKKSSRTAAEGLLALVQNESKVAVIELNCETDFVARNEIFQYLALSLAKLALLVDSSSQQVSGAFPVRAEILEELKINLDHPKLSGEKTVQTAIAELAAIMGENVKLRRGFAMSAPSQGIISTYLHTSPQPGLGRIAGILSFEVEDKNASLDSLQRVGSELAMHVVAAKPLFLTRDHVSSDALENEREILKSQAESTGKPQMAIEKMVEGRLRKYYEEVVLMEQKFVVNDSLNVKTLLDNLSKEVGSPVKIGSFCRMEVGEGIQRLEASNEREPVAQSA
ncbi:elongation factor Ts, mitochondrial [Rhododendron vialii]|uniref:elongation factor Ts, mitochondrial n=1 Tax=Rhododendron vialii TaxID=182163 RepID=UPI00265D70D1|nr:elongation factor Ts, mitochondrial [Rhododendron vialii]XP_058211256.1 elongation factor Ts, mitochondrial [Rhododendron vialii]